MKKIIRAIEDKIANEQCAELDARLDGYKKEADLIILRIADLQ